MSIEHNVVVVGGLEYKAEIAGNRGCLQCDIAEQFKGNLGNCHVMCGPMPRSSFNQEDLIFKRHHRPTHKDLQNLNLDIEVQNG